MEPDGTTPPGRRDWTPVAPAWERKPDQCDLWRRVTTLPSLVLNRVELELLGPVAGRSTLVIGAGDGLAPLALAALGARVQVVDGSSSLLDIVLVRTQLLGLNIEYRRLDLDEFDQLRDCSHEVVYAAHVAPRTPRLDRVYREVRRVLAPGGRVVVTEYHPVRRIWKQEPGAPRAATSYFERCREQPEADGEYPWSPGGSLARFDYQWTLSDHFYYLTAAGLRVSAVEEVGEVRQDWEVPNLRGLPEQLVIAAERPLNEPDPKQEE